PPVLGDKIQFQQVILNLITNGLEATSGVNGRPRRLDIRTQIRGTDQVQVSVSDSGVSTAENKPDWSSPMLNCFAKVYSRRVSGHRYLTATESSRQQKSRHRALALLPPRF